MAAESSAYCPHPASVKGKTTIPSSVWRGDQLIHKQRVWYDTYRGEIDRDVWNLRIQWTSAGRRNANILLWWLGWLFLLSLSLTTDEYFLMMSLRLQMLIMLSSLLMGTEAGGEHKIYLSAENWVNLRRQLIPYWWQNDGGRSCDWVMMPERCGIRGSSI